MGKQVTFEEQVAAAFGECGWNVRLPAIGEGSFKSVFEAEAPNGDEVVLKVVKQPLEAAEAEPTGNLPERFLREMDAMRSLRSPRVVRVLDGPDVMPMGGIRVVWYTEPHLRGGDMSERLGSLWTEAATISLLLDLVDGVAALAAHGLVHRDIKPDNIMFDEDGRAVLIDLGIALHLNAETLTRTGHESPRTDTYAAPEQFQPRPTAPIDFRTDLFAIGIVAFEARTGVHPFLQEHITVIDYVADLIAGRVDEQALQQAEVGPKLQAVLRRLLSPEMNRRYRKLTFAREAIEDCT